jgi:hypothetical protein
MHLSALLRLPTYILRVLAIRLFPFAFGGSSGRRSMGSPDFRYR